MKRILSLMVFAGSLIYGFGGVEAVFQTLQPVFGSRCIHDICGGRETDIYFAGDAGTILHFDGSAFDHVPRLTLSDLRCIWGDADGTVYAAGMDGVLLVRDAGIWRRIQKNRHYRFNGIWGLTPGSIYIAGDDEEGNGYVWKWDGTTLAEMLIVDMPLNGIWGEPPDRLIAVGNSHRIYCWDGQVWELHTGEYTTDFTCIWGASSDAVFAGDNAGLMFKLDDGNPECIGSTFLSGMIYDVSGTSAKDVYFTGHYAVDFYPGKYYYFVISRWDGAQMTTVCETESTDYQTAIWGADAETYYSGSINGGIRSSLTDWTPLAGNLALHIRDIEVTDDHNVLVCCDDGSVLHWDGADWRILEMDESRYLTGIWAATPDSVYASGGDIDSGFILHWDGLSWTQVYTVTSGISDIIYDIDGLNEREIYACGWNGLLVRWDGTEWAELDTGLTELIQNLWINTSNDVYFTGLNGAIYRWNGTSVASVTGSLGKTVYDFWGTSPNDIYLSTYRTLYRYNGVSLVEIDLPWAVYESHIWGTGPSDIFVCGRSESCSGGSVQHWNGSGWSRLADRGFFKCIAGSDTGHVCLGGYYGNVTLWDGTIPDYGTRLALNWTFFTPGDRFRLTAAPVIPEETGRKVYIAIILDAGAGSFWFWPGWTAYPEADWEFAELNPNMQMEMTILEFDWPDTGSATANNLSFWGIMFDTSGNITGDPDHLPFGFGPCQ